jgi:hypothetical protein
MTTPDTDTLIAKYGEPDDCAENSDLDNNDRADLASGPYRHYVSACTSYGDDDLFDPDVLTEQVGDLIAALLHLVARNSGSPEAAHGSGWSHFSREVGLGY